MPAPSPELTLIVAATARNMGIGLAGDLPWAGLRKEMAYFARVTKRAPQPGDSSNPNAQAPRRNAVIMGRKTWDSIPLKFRPLRSRLNIVLSRSHANAAAAAAAATPADGEQPLRLASLSDALDVLRSREDTGKVFVIGGAEVYRAALREEATKRILLTRVLSDFDCDTLFPITLQQQGDGAEWKKKSKEELDAWVGEEVAQGEQEENGTRYIYEMYERD